MASESSLRKKVATWGDAYIGIKEGSTQHKEILNIFNNSGLCTRYKMTTSDAWCAAFVSAAFIACNLTDVFPCVECSCSQMITKAESAGLWIESDSHSPKQGDVILYDWQDSGAGDNAGNPDHVGIVYSVSGNSFKVIEGNMNSTVGYRSMTVNGKYIRGYIVPKYSKAGTASSTSTSISVLTVDGQWGVKTSTRLQQVLGTEADGIISHQYRAYQASNPGCLAETFQWESKPSGYSPCIKALQGVIGATRDGYIGPNTIKALQKHYGTVQDGTISKVSDVVKAMQTSLNSGKV